MKMAPIEIQQGNDVFSVEREPPQSYSTWSPRADPAWRFTDAAGHEHRWHGREPSASLPTLVLVEDEPTEHYPDGDPIPASHYECLQCREVIVPGTVVDTSPFYVPARPEDHGYYVNGQRVTLAEFKRRWVDAGGTLPEGVS